MPSGYGERAGSLRAFVFDRNRMLVTRGGVAVPLGGRSAALLGALLDANGRAVEKDALIAAAWPGMIVEDGNLTVHSSPQPRGQLACRVRSVIASARKLLSGTSRRSW